MRKTKTKTNHNKTNQTGRKNNYTNNQNMQRKNQNLKTNNVGKTRKTRGCCSSTSPTGFCLA